MTIERDRDSAAHTSPEERHDYLNAKVTKELDNCIDTDGKYDIISGTLFTLLTLLLVPQHVSAQPDEKPYSIYDSSEKWTIVTIASVAGIFR
jgi:hypothetical protein